MKPIKFNFAAPYRAALTDSKAPPTVQTEKHDAATLEAAREWLRDRLEADALELRGQCRNGEAGMLFDWLGDEFTSCQLYGALEAPVSLPEHGYCMSIEPRQVLPEDLPRATAELALLFRAEVRDALSPANLRAVDRDNRNRADYTRDDVSICYSHDYCDANQLMINAFNALMSRDPAAHLSHDADMINAAWDAAKSFGFSDSNTLED